VTQLVEILGIPLLVCLEMIAILGYLGIHVLKREVIFIDIALAQIAAVGAIGAELAFEAHGHSALGYSCAFGATLVAAAFFSLVRRRVVQIPLEAVIGVSYAIAAAGALFLVGIAPGGHVHVQQMLAGSILWATWADVVWAGLLFGLVGSCFYVFRRPFASISEDYEGTAREGANTLGWDLLFYALLGVVVTLAVRIAGVVVVFAFLIIPATLSALLASGWRERLIVAWATGAIASVLGLLFAERLDFSVGPAIALFLGAALVLVGLLRLLRASRSLSARLCLTIALGALLWFLFMSASPG
jgi:zinc/manganese transport system permease protein